MEKAKKTPKAATKKAAKPETPSATPTTAAASKEKKPPRMSKKKKDELAKEQEKKIEERKKILTSEWDDEEDGEAEVEEKKKMKQNMGDDADADDESDAESDQEAHFQDDNIQGNYYDDDDDEIYEEEKKSVDDILKNLEEDTEKETEMETKETSTSGPAVEPEPVKEVLQNPDDKAALESVAKILEETKVPEFPSADLLNEMVGGMSKKSVKFSPQISKEFAITKMALVQPKSNLAGPMEVDDEFAEAEELVEVKSSARTILKRSRSPPPPPQAISESDDEDESTPPEETQKVTSTVSELVTPETNLGAAEAPVTTESTKTAEYIPEVTASEDKSTTEAAATMLALGQQNSDQTVTDHSNAIVTEASEAGIGKDGNTYLLVVDETNQFSGDQLNSQTFYIDSNSLANGGLIQANGDLSHMVLTTEATNGQHQIISTQDATAAVDQAATTTEDK